MGPLFYIVAFEDAARFGAPWVPRCCLHPAVPFTWVDSFLQKPQTTKSHLKRLQNGTFVLNEANSVKEQGCWRKNPISLAQYTTGQLFNPGVFRLSVPRTSKYNDSLQALPFENKDRYLFSYENLVIECEKNSKGNTI